MSRAAIFCFVGLFSVAGCREDAVVAPRVRVPGGALADGRVSGPRVASGYVAVDFVRLFPTMTGSRATARGPLGVRTV